jgi:hypothetical protein
MHLPSFADRREPIAPIEGWLVRFHNGALTFVTTDPMTWHPKIICRVRAIHRTTRPVPSQPILDDGHLQ